MTSGFLTDTWRKRYLPATILGGATLTKTLSGLNEASSIASAGEANAGAYRSAADIVGAQGAVEDRQFVRLSRKLRESNRTQAAGSGFAVSGSVVDAMADTAAQLELQRQLNKWKITTERNQLTANATNIQRQAKFQSSQAQWSAASALAEGLFKLTDLFG